MEATAPDLVTAVIGFRQWRLRGSELWSLRATERWHRGVHTAHCDLGRHDGSGAREGLQVRDLCVVRPATSRSFCCDPRPGRRRRCALGPDRAARPRHASPARDGRRPRAPVLVGREAPATPSCSRWFRGSRRPGAQAALSGVGARRCDPPVDASSRHDAEQTPGARPPCPRSALCRGGRIPGQEGVRAVAGRRSARLTCSCSEPAVSAGSVLGACRECHGDGGQCANTGARSELWRVEHTLRA